MSERVRFQADANLNAVIIKGTLRRQPLVDMRTAEVAGLAGVPDPEVLARTAQAARVLVSHDFHTLPGHFADFLASGQHSPGVLLLHQTLPVAQAIAALLLVWDASDPAEWRDRLTYLPL
ncbi:MAG: DUF5615 family PIN-like protein [Ktedonobacterales bacterium]|nr:DUF5615 family PIN-like protein [Ktedonobacterales bacterium]